MTNNKDWIPACTGNCYSALSPESLYLLRSLRASCPHVRHVHPGRCSRRGSRLGHPRQLLHALLSVLVPDRTLPRTSLCSYLLRPCNRASLYLTRLGNCSCVALSLHVHVGRSVRNFLHLTSMDDVHGGTSVAGGRTPEATGGNAIGM